MKLTKLTSLLLIAAILIPSLAGCKKEKVQYKNVSFAYFDTVTTIIGSETSEEKFAEVSGDALALLGEYHKLYDIYNEYPGIVNLCTINKLVNGEHQKLTVDSKIIDMLLYAKEMYEKTNGKMNVAMGSVLSIWHDYRNEGIDEPWNAKLPPMDILKEASLHTDINNLIIDEENSTVYIADPKMTLDVGAVAKGYAVEMVAKYLKELGKDNYVLNVGGNIRATGVKATGERWQAGVENPEGDEDNPYIAYIELDNMASVTSGSYQRYYVVGGKRYHHIIDPTTLMPAIGFKSVSLICSSSADGDCLSTALFCMSLEDGMKLVDSLEGVEALWVTDDGEIHYSKNYKDYCYK